MQTLQRPKIRDQAAEEIKRYIVDRQLAPGDRLPTENQLAEDFDISRLSVREATKALEFLGIVESKTGVGGFWRPAACLLSAVSRKRQEIRMERRNQKPSAID